MSLLEHFSHALKWELASPASFIRTCSDGQFINPMSGGKAVDCGNHDSKDVQAEANTQARASHGWLLSLSSLPVFKRCSQPGHHIFLRTWCPGFFWIYPFQTCQANEYPDMGAQKPPMSWVYQSSQFDIKVVANDKMAPRKAAAAAASEILAPSSREEKCCLWTLERHWSTMPRSEVAWGLESGRPNSKHGLRHWDSLASVSSCFQGL